MNQLIKLKPQRPIKPRHYSQPVKELKLSESAKNYLYYELTQMNSSKVQESFDEITKDVFHSHATPDGKTSIWNLIINPAELNNVLLESLKPFENKSEEDVVVAKIAALMLRCKRVKFKLFVIRQFITFDKNLPLRALNRQYSSICDEIKNQLIHLDFRKIPQPQIKGSEFTYKTTFNLIIRHMIVFESRLKEFLPGICEVNRIGVIKPELRLPDLIYNSLLNMAPTNLKNTQPDLYVLFRLILSRRPPNFDEKQLNQWESYYNEFCSITSFWYLGSNDQELLDFEDILPKDYHIKFTWDEISKMPIISEKLFGQIINTFTKLSPYFWYLSLNFYLKSRAKPVSKE